MEQDDQRSFDFERAIHTKEYVLALAAFADVHKFDIGVNFNELMEYDGYEFINAFEIASSKIKFFSNKCAFKFSQRMKSGSTSIYVLEESSKTVIHKYLNKVRVIISKADLTPLQKYSLASKLNAFALEVDKDRSKLEA